MPVGEEAAASARAAGRQEDVGVGVADAAVARGGMIPTNVLMPSQTHTSTRRAQLSARNLSPHEALSDLFSDPAIPRRYNREEYEANAKCGTGAATSPKRKSGRRSRSWGVS